MLSLNAANVPLPKAIPGLRLWLDARYAEPGTYDNGIDRVRDLSGRNNHAIGTSPNRPVYLNGQLKAGTRPSVYLPDYELDFLDIQGPDDPGGGGEPGIVCPNSYSVFVTFKTLGNDTASDYAGDTPMPILGNRRSWVYNCFGLNDGQVEYRNYYSSWTTTTSTGLTLNDGNVHTIAVCHKLDGTVTLYADGVAVKSASGVGYEVAYTGCATVGRGYSDVNQALDVNLGELMVWDGPVTASQVENLHRRAMSAWR